MHEIKHYIRCFLAPLAAIPSESGSAAGAASVFVGQAVAREINTVVALDAGQVMIEARRALRAHSGRVILLGSGSAIEDFDNS